MKNRLRTESAVEAVNHVEKFINESFAKYSGLLKSDIVLIADEQEETANFGDIKAVLKDGRIKIIHDEFKEGYEVIDFSELSNLKDKAKVHDIVLAHIAFKV